MAVQLAVSEFKEAMQAGGVQQVAVAAGAPTAQGLAAVKIEQDAAPSEATAAAPAAELGHAAAGGSGLSFGELQQILAKSLTADQQRSELLAPLRRVGRGLGGTEADLAARQVLDLLLQWPCELARLQQLVADETSGKPVISAKTAAKLNRAVIRLLALPQVAAQFTNSVALQQVQRMCESKKEEWNAAIRSSAAAAAAAGAKSGQPGATSEPDADRSPGAGLPAAAAAGKAGRSGIAVATRGGADVTFAQLQGLLAAEKLAPSNRQDMLSALRRVARLLDITDQALADCSVVYLCKQWRLLEADLDRHVAGRVHGEPPLSGAQAERLARGTYNVLALPAIEAQFSSRGELPLLQRLRDATSAKKVQWNAAYYAAVRSPAAAGCSAAAPAAAAKGKQHGVAAGLTYKQLPVLTKGHEGFTTKIMCPLQRISDLMGLTDDQFAAKPVVELLTQWPVLQAYLQQRVANQVAGEPEMSPATAAGAALALCRYLSLKEVQDQFTDKQQLQQLQEAVEAQKSSWYRMKRGSNVQHGGDGNEKAGQQHRCNCQQAGAADDKMVLTSKVQTLIALGPQLQLMVMGRG